MQMEILWQVYEKGTQRQGSIQGFAVQGLMLYLTEEGLEGETFLTVRTPSTTLVERINLDIMHQISDYKGGAANNNMNQGLIYVDLGLVSLGDSEEMMVILDCEGTPSTGSDKFIGVSALICDLPEHDEMIYHYQHHTDTSFSTDAAAALYVFKTPMHESGELINIKVGQDVRSTTLRSCNWYANLMGKIELENITMGVVFENAYGQPLVFNTASTGVTSIVKRVHQVDGVRREKATARLADQVVRKYNSLDAQTRRAIP